MPTSAQGLAKASQPPRPETPLRPMALGMGLSGQIRTYLPGRVRFLANHALAPATEDASIR